MILFNKLVLFPVVLFLVGDKPPSTMAFSSLSSLSIRNHDVVVAPMRAKKANTENNIEEEDEGMMMMMMTRRNAVLSTTAAMMMIPTLLPQPALARLEAVNRPDLLPSESGLNVIQTSKFLTNGQTKRLDTMLSNLEKDTGFRLRVLCQNYPNTPGLAIREYWDLGKEGQKDDKYIVLVVDEFGGKANVLNFNVGDGVKFALPNVFWTRLSGKYGTKFYVRDNGIDLAITNAVEAIVSCLRSEDGYCTNPPDEAESMKGLGFR